MRVTIWPKRNLAGAALLVAQFAVSATAQVPTAQAPATPGAALLPTSPWRVDYAESECRLIRRFGAGSGEVTLRIARASSFDFYDMVIGGPGVPNLPDHVEVQTRLEPQAQLLESTGYSLPLPDGSGHFLRWYDIRTPFVSQMTATQDMTLHVRDTTISLHLTNVTQALAALQLCHDDLLREWGLDVAAYRALQSPPTPHGAEAGWVTTADYPDTTAQGTVTTIMSVGSDGRVTNCRIQVSSRAPELDSAACRALTRRARFNPAIAADGTPVTSWFVRRVVWRLP
jgi:TonB family protein